MKTSEVKAQEQQWSNLLVEQARKRNGYDQQNGRRGNEIERNWLENQAVSTEVWDSV